MTAALALLLGAPAASAAILGLVLPVRRSGRKAAWLSIAAVSSSFVAALWLLRQFIASPEPRSWEFVWAPFGDGAAIRFGVLLDGLSVPMLVLVSGVALAVQIYSVSYMAAERPTALGRYYAYHGLFTAAMLGLVAAHNTLQSYFFWELVGLGSYLLIGFWHQKPEAVRAATKAFWTTRLGDVGFAFGLIFLWSGSGTFVFEELFDSANAGRLSGSMLSLGVAGLFLGAMGKSAQFPLHVWLPDAMEGPTPVSALIHAATMVAAGVYLMARITPLLTLVPAVAGIVLSLGVLTALLAATLALVARDVKRILAYSTVSQLGYMMAAVGASATAAGFFHLTTHAFFKALLFLAAGSLIHAVHTNDIFEMGGLWKRMPLTGACFLVGSLALAGVPPLSGFWSKDEILISLWEGGHRFAFAALVLAAGLTAFYVFRAFFVIFFGGNAGSMKAHEAPSTMTLPMAALSLAAIGGGALGEPIHAWIGASISGPRSGAVEHGADWVPVLATSVGLLGIAVAWLGYSRRAYRPEVWRARLAPVVRLLERGYYVDDAFLAGYRVLYLDLGRMVGWFDRYVIDGCVNLATWVTWQSAGRLRAIQTGRPQDALYAIAVGFLLLICLAWWG